MRPSGPSGSRRPSAAPARSRQARLPQAHSTNDAFRSLRRGLWVQFSGGARRPDAAECEEHQGEPSTQHRLRRLWSRGTHRANASGRTSSISGRARRRQGQTERSRCARSAACASSAAMQQPLWAEAPAESHAFGKSGVPPVMFRLRFRVSGRPLVGELAASHPMRRADSRQCQLK